VLNIICVTQFVSSLTVREPQSRDMGQRVQMISSLLFCTSLP